MHVGVFGATGQVGGVLRTLLEERNYPVESIRFFASHRSAGRTLPWKGEEVVVEDIAKADFSGLDVALFSAGGSTSKEYAEKVAAAGATVVDNSSAWRMDERVPLIVSEVNPEDVAWHKGIIANPNCSTIITVTAVNALNKISPIRTMTASTYQAVSGAGAGGPIELMGEVEALSKGESYEPKVFPYQIAFNLIPQIGGEKEQGYTSEEMKLHYEGRKIMQVVRSHSISVSMHFDVPVTVEQAREVIASAPGCKLVDDLAAKQYPMPLDTTDQDIVFVGRIRPDITDECGLTLWCCGDQVRKGAATNAIQIAELLVK